MTLDEIVAKLKPEWDAITIRVYRDGLCSIDVSRLNSQAKSKQGLSLEETVINSEWLIGSGSTPEEAYNQLLASK